MSIPFEKALRGSKAFKLIEKDVKLGISHAYMLICPDDDAVDSFFKLAAALIYCENGNACLECAGCRRVIHGTHSDIYHLNEKREKIKADDISKGLLPTVDVRSLSEKKLYFIHRADLMLPAAQNKLLKTLEEPPADVTIFLGVANESSMLETIRSRSRKLYMDSFDSETVYQALLEEGIAPDHASVAAACSEGMLGKAMMVANSDEYIALYDTAVELMKTLLKSSDIINADTLILSQKSVPALLNVLSIIIRDMLVAKKNPELMLSKHIYGDIIELSEGYSERALANILIKINELRKKLSLNVNALASVDSLLFSMLEVKHKWQ